MTCCTCQPGTSLASLEGEREDILARRQWAFNVKSFWHYVLWVRKVRPALMEVRDTTDNGQRKVMAINLLAELEQTKPESARIQREINATIREAVRRGEIGSDDVPQLEALPVLLVVLFRVAVVLGTAAVVANAIQISRLTYQNRKIKAKVDDLLVAHGWEPMELPDIPFWTDGFGGSGGIAGFFSEAKGLIMLGIGAFILTKVWR